MRDVEYERLRKSAALHEMDSAAHAWARIGTYADDWDRALSHLAKSEQRSGETFEMAYARVARDHADGRRFFKMASVSERRPQVAKAAAPAEDRRTSAEKALDEMATERARTQGIPWHTAYAEILRTADGRRLQAAYQNGG